MNGEKQRQAALYTVLHGQTVDERRQLLEMLGLIPAKPRPKRKPGRQAGTYEHGHPAKYRQGCRCDACRAGVTAAYRAWRAQARQDPTAADRAGHGKYTTYRNHGCRCVPCREDHRLQHAARRAQQKAVAA
jgi:hypothetical protein